MAAPHVTGLIAMMYAYNPDLTSTDVLKILKIYDPKTRRSAKAPAPVIDAFDAMVACRNEAFLDLADLTRDGRVDMEDFRMFKRHLRQVEKNIGNEDLNGDGDSDNDENIYPRSDLNGSGRLSRDPVDEREIRAPGDIEGKQPRKKLSDLGVMMEVWQDTGVSKWDLPKMLDLPN